MATVLTQLGEEWVVDLIDGTISANTDYVGWGTGAGTAAKSDTDVFTAATEARVAATRSQPIADRVRWVATITANGSKTITNAGVFDAAGSGSPPSGGGPMVIHGDFTGVAVVLNDSIQFTVELEIT